MMRSTSRIFIIGHNDSIENSLRGFFRSKGFSQVVSNTHDRIDVLSQSKVEAFFKKFKPEYVFLGSLRSGGISANQKFPGEFIYENLLSQGFIIEAARHFGIKKLLYVGGSCMYPKVTQQPIQENAFLTGALEETSGPYAVAKIAGVKMCQAYQAQYALKAVSVVPATLYGPGSDTDIQSAHVLGALIAKFHQAKLNGNKQVVVWGTGKPKREFLYVDDFAEACLFLMDKYNDSLLINVGSGEEVTIKKLALIIKEITGCKAKIIFDASKPEGALRKLLDSTRLRKLGWRPKVGLEEGIERTYQWYAKVASSKR